MISDDELELDRLAARFLQDSEFVEPCQEIKLDYFQGLQTFKAGFKAAEKMMQDRWPVEKEFYTWLGRHKSPPAYQLIYDWLKQKMLSSK